MGGGVKLSFVVTRQTVPLPVFGTHASLLGVFRQPYTQSDAEVVKVAQRSVLRVTKDQKVCYMQGETQGITSIQDSEEEISSPVCTSPSSFGSSALSKCYFRMFSWFSRAFCTQSCFHRLLPWSSS